METFEDKRTLLGYDINVDELVQTLRARRRLLFAVVLGTILLVIVYLHIAVYTYTATLMVSPVLSSSSDSSSSELGSLKGLASLAGINVGGNMGTQAFMLYQEGLYSRDVADELAKNPDIMHTVYRGQWDAANKQWVEPPGAVRALAAVVKGILGIPDHPWQPPDGALLQDYIADNVSVDADPQKPVVTISYSSQDPQFAVKFLRELDRAVDNKLRTNALVRANQYSSYLSDQLNKVTNTTVREALMTTLTDQEKIKMMASVTAPYAAQPFGLPSASRRPTNPKPILALAVGVFVGGLLGIAAALWLPPLDRPSRRFKALLGKLGLGTVQ